MEKKKTKNKKQINNKRKMNNRKLLKLAVNEIDEKIELFKKEIEKVNCVEYVGNRENLDFLFKFPEVIDKRTFFTEEEIDTLNEDDLMAELIVRAVKRPKVLYNKIFGDMKNIISYDNTKIVTCDDIDDSFLLVNLKSDCVKLC